METNSEIQKQKDKLEALYEQRDVLDASIDEIEGKLRAEEEKEYLSKYVKFQNGAYSTGYIRIDKVSISGTIVKVMGPAVYVGNESEPLVRVSGYDFTSFNKFRFDNLTFIDKDEFCHAMKYAKEKFNNLITPLMI